MSEIKNYSNAFPVITFNNNGEVNVSIDGLTIRQYYAGRAMQGLVHQNLSVDRALNEKDNFQVKSLAEAAVKISDFLIAELNKEKP